jgi:hypothetical protein
MDPDKIIGGLSKECDGGTESATSDRLGHIKKQTISVVAK